MVGKDENKFTERERERERERYSIFGKALKRIFSRRRGSLSIYLGEERLDVDIYGV